MEELEQNSESREERNKKILEGMKRSRRLLEEYENRQIQKEKAKKRDRKIKKLE